ncbi:Intradiol ring-cleavage dioxygenase [Cadophora sp. MPI-SDFR-AT-0126]|nr:Intradiol ring-cleavage dioxygenase [Leotiomycetes sp. MPI-SDFR-AT-0126]KAH7389247.1 Intradiol ring-cleavage dioxygenase [Leotiomycetes sp. MPI-SDFR-AT-0126]
MHFSTLFAGAALASYAIAHPGHDIHAEMQKREAALAGLPRSLDHCAEKLEARGITAEAAARREAAFRKAREERGIDPDSPQLKARDATTVLATSHLSGTTYSPSTAASVLFAGMNTCVLSPEVTQGPYYVGGEFVRPDIRDGQKGVEVILDTLVIDMSTCNPVTNAMIEIWHTNSTGVYGGIVANGNGAGTRDPSNAYNTFHRGLQHVDSSGVAQFITNFPGHYTGRTTHIHVLAHLNGAVTSKGKYEGGTNAHVGQLFFDQSLISQVEAVSPYSTNTQSLTTNSADGIFRQEAATSDPVVHYSFLGTSVSQGIFAWVAFGINTSNNLNVGQAASLAATVTVTNAQTGTATATTTTRTA